MHVLKQNGVRDIVADVLREGVDAEPEVRVDLVELGAGKGEPVVDVSPGLGEGEAGHDLAPEFDGLGDH